MKDIIKSFSPCSFQSIFPGQKHPNEPAFPHGRLAGFPSRSIHAQTRQTAPGIQQLPGWNKGAFWEDTRDYISPASFYPHVFLLEIYPLCLFCAQFYLKTAPTAKFDLFIQKLT